MCTISFKPRSTPRPDSHPSDRAPTVSQASYHCNEQAPRRCSNTTQHPHNRASSPDLHQNSVAEPVLALSQRPTQISTAHTAILHAQPRHPRRRSSDVVRDGLVTATAWLCLQTWKYLVVVQTWISLVVVDQSIETWKFLAAVLETCGSTGSRHTVTHTRWRRRLTRRPRHKRTPTSQLMRCFVRIAKKLFQEGFAEALLRPLRNCSQGAGPLRNHRDS